MIEPMDSPHIVIGLRRHPRETDDRFEERKQELAGLCEAAGGQVVGEFVQVRADVDSALYLGTGKVQEMASGVQELEAGLVVFDQELSPAQIRNLEAKLDCRVIDRTQLILDIFALRARSKEGRLQVEIAQLQYLLPRLTGRGVEMSRLGGGIGTRGPGETKLEVDRRRIRHRVSHLRSQLKEVRRAREVQRQRRVKGVPTVALVGYTNAGKTTLLNRWTKERGYGNAETGHNRLFDTLDPSARRVKTPVRGEMVLLDTVGFVQDLPHLLVEAFRATLEEVLAADVIVHVVDGSRHPEVHLQTTYEVLKEIGAMDKPVVTFFNKMDVALTQPAPDMKAAVSIYGSASQGDEISALYAAVERVIEMDPVTMVVTGHAGDESLWRELVTSSRVVTTDHLPDDVVRFTVEVGRRDAGRLRDLFSRKYEWAVELGEAQSEDPVDERSSERGRTPV